MMIRPILSATLLAAAMLAAGAVPAHAQEASAQAVARAKARMSTQAAAQFEQTVRATRERGLPTGPLVAKALEGMAKGIPGERVVVAVRGLADRLAQADAILSVRGKPAAVEVAAVADALQRGVPEDAVRRVHKDARPGESVALSVHALADLMDRGVPVAVGLEVIGAWRGRGADPARLHEIPAAVERLVRQGVMPAHAGAAVAAGVKLGRGLGTIGPADIGDLVGGGRGKGKGRP